MSSKIALNTFVWKTWVYVRENRNRYFEGEKKNCDRILERTNSWLLGNWKYRWVLACMNSKDQNSAYIHSHRAWPDFRCTCVLECLALSPAPRALWKMCLSLQCSSWVERSFWPSLGENPSQRVLRAAARRPATSEVPHQLCWNMNTPEFLWAGEERSTEMWLWIDIPQSLADQNWATFQNLEIQRNMIFPTSVESWSKFTSSVLPVLCIYEILFYLTLV